MTVSSVYPPCHHAEHSQEKLVRLIEILRLATLVSVDNGDTAVSFIPMLVEHGSAGVTLLGHMDAANPQAALLNGHAMQAIFHGPQAYISPDDYRSPQLPTWNYVHVVAAGQATEMPADADKRALLVRMSSIYGGLSQDFVLDTEDQRMRGMLGGIRAFRLQVDHLVGRFKLSQDKNSGDTQAALVAMKRKSAARETAVFRWIDEGMPT